MGQKSHLCLSAKQISNEILNKTFCKFLMQFNVFYLQPKGDFWKRSVHEVSLTTDALNKPVIYLLTVLTVLQEELLVYCHGVYLVNAPLLAHSLTVINRISSVCRPTGARHVVNHFLRHFMVSVDVT